MSNNLNHQMLALDSLVPFEGHPFETYEGQRFTDMVESIRTNGVIVPIVVRPKENGKYEILSGHNRVKAANEVKEAQGELVQAIVRDDLTDDEALLIVTETNLIQRSFADLKHSERAVALATHYDALKMKRGYRSDLLDEINALTCSPVANKSKTANKLGEQYGLAKDTIFRYIRIHELCIDLKEKLDNSEIAVRTSVSLSYLRKKEQDIIAGLISDGVKVSMKQAEFLRNESSKGELSKTAIKGFLKANEKPEKPRSIKFNERFLAQYFDEDKSNEEIEGIVAKALELYFSQINSE